MKKLLFFLCLFALGGCDFLQPSTPIADILKDPQSYEGKKVTVSGEVVGATNLGILKYFTLEDASGRITIIPKGAVPIEGKQMKVTGMVSQLLKLGDAQVVAITEEEPEN